MNASRHPSYLFILPVHCLFLFPHYSITHMSDWDSSHIARMTASQVSALKLMDLLVKVIPSLTGGPSRCPS